MDDNSIVIYWKCFAEAEKALARLMALSWNGFSCATLKSIALALATAYAPTWGEKRLDAFVGNWSCTYQMIEVEGVELEFVVCTNAWVPSLIELVSEGGGAIEPPTCRQAVGFG